MDEIDQARRASLDTYEQERIARGDVDNRTTEEIEESANAVHEQPLEHLIQKAIELKRKLNTRRILDDLGGYKNGITQLVDSIDEQFKCPVDYTVFIDEEGRRPCMFPCGHNICERCIQKMCKHNLYVCDDQESSTQYYYIQCGLCRAESIDLYKYGNNVNSSHLKLFELTHPFENRLLKMLHTIKKNIQDEIFIEMFRDVKFYKIPYEYISTIMVQMFKDLGINSVYVCDKKFDVDPIIITPDFLAKLFELSHTTYTIDGLNVGKKYIYYNPMVSYDSYKFNSFHECVEYSHDILSIYDSGLTVDAVKQEFVEFIGYNTLQYKSKVSVENIENKFELVDYKYKPQSQRDVDIDNFVNRNYALLKMILDHIDEWNDVLMYHETSSITSQEHLISPLVSSSPEPSP
uniref:RING-type domain-containing protein n=1 Tax=viral metagenome TaxID=1070528 RepID=A0A6C0CL75_9ZZZZ